MQALRDILNTTLGKSLSALTPLDRLSAAWPVAAGHAIADRSRVTELEGTIATVLVADRTWQRQLQSTHNMLRAELSRIARVPLTAILFVAPTESETPRRKPA